MVGNIGIALVLMFIVMAAVFESLLFPLAIMSCVLFSIFGVYWLFWLTGTEFNIMAIIGILVLMGVVVNNGIVLIDYIDILRRQMKDELGLGENGRLSTKEEIECIILGGKTRLRPVLLTAITTVLGLIPLAIGFNFDFYGLLTELNPGIYFGGDNADFWSPMSWTVIFGLTTSTVLTLIMSPVMFLLAVRIRNRFIKASKEQD